MSMESAIREHLDEGDVVRLLDQEATEEEITGWMAHLHGCEPCRRLRDEIRETSGWFRSSVSLLDEGASVDDVTRARALSALRAAVADRQPDSPSAAGVPALKGGGEKRGRASNQRRPVYRLAAAGVGIILFAGLAVEPVRAWIRDNVLDVAPRAEAPAGETVIATTPAPSAASARFSARGPSFQIELGQRQLEGTLTVRLTSDEQASAEISGSAGETLVVLPSGLGIGNDAESTASYIVELPAGEIREIVVRAGGQLLGTRTLSTAGEAVELDLATGAATP